MFAWCLTALSTQTNPKFRVLSNLYLILLVEGGCSCRVQSLFGTVQRGGRRRLRKTAAAVQTGDGRRRPVIAAVARAAVTVSPEILAGLEALAALQARVRASRRVDSLVKPHGRRVLEPLSTHAALTWVLVAVLVQVVLLQVHLHSQPITITITITITIIITITITTITTTTTIVITIFGAS